MKSGQEVLLQVSAAPDDVHRIVAVLVLAGVLEHFPEVGRALVPPTDSTRASQQERAGGLRTAATAAPQLAGYEASYCRNLLDMTALVLDSAEIAGREVATEFATYVCREAIDTG